jgi:hypothetical protein
LYISYLSLPAQGRRQFQLQLFTRFTQKQNPQTRKPGNPVHCSCARLTESPQPGRSSRTVPDKSQVLFFLARFDQHRGAFTLKISDSIQKPLIRSCKRSCSVYLVILQFRAQRREKQVFSAQWLEQ